MGFNILDKEGNHIGWTASEFDNGSELQFVDDTLEIAPDIDTLKANKIKAIKQQAAQMIADTDWQLQRANERDSIGVKADDIDTPKQVLAKRESIRRASNRSESEVNALTDATAINDYVMSIQDADYPSSKPLTRLEFLRRFTESERVAITTAAAQNPILHDYMQMLNAAKLINMTDVDVAGGVTMLEQAGVIGTGRASEILQGV